LTSSGPGQPSSRQTNRSQQPSGSNRRRRFSQGPNHPAASAATSAVSQLDAALSAAQQRPAPAVESFGDFGLPTQIVSVLAQAGIARPTPIQAKTLPDALAGRDLLGRAQTGSGKTLGFGLPMLTRLAATDTRPVTKSPRGLVLVPTRELAQQVADALSPAAGALRLHVGVVVGGTSIGCQVDELRRGVEVLIATPGRLLDLMDRDAVRLTAIEIAVLDEADHMADLGFLPAVTRILDATPGDRQCLLFSATLDHAVSRLVTRYLRDPAIHAAAPVTTATATMTHMVFTVVAADKVAVAAEIGARPARTLFFVRTKHGADRLAKQLSRAGTAAVALHGNLNQNQRTRALDQFAAGRSRVLVATDVAARGLHVDDLDLVVHFDPPVDHKTYLHRSGRTARAGASGTVISVVEPEQERAVAAIHAAATVRPSRATVFPGHHAVRRVATSGEPIDVATAQLADAAQRGNPATAHRGPGASRQSGPARGRRATRPVTQTKADAGRGKASGLAPRTASG